MGCLVTPFIVLRVVVVGFLSFTGRFFTGGFVDGPQRVGWGQRIGIEVM
jgi:hypothetical protein